jgi:hypothetical protein
VPGLAPRRTTDSPTAWEACPPYEGTRRR